jgi:hypothetical protein
MDEIVKYIYFDDHINQCTLLPVSIVNLWHQTTICQSYLIANTILASTSKQQLFNGLETPINKVLRPFLLVTNLP